MLLSDPEVIKLVNSRFVACWESVRPVPKVTIDFGDGRTIKRTLQGNTVLYLCVPDGRVVDALPGVYTPAAFLRETQCTLDSLKMIDMPGSFHAQPLAEALPKWHLSQVGAAIQGERARITMSKQAVESPLLKALKLSARVSPPTAQTVVAQTAETPAAEAPVKDPAAAFSALSSKIEDMSHQPSSAEQIKAMYAGRPDGQIPSPEQMGKMAVEMDSQNNLRVVRPAVHLLFASMQKLPQPKDCRDTIYKKVLQVPIDDPNLGLSEIVVPGTK